MSAYEGHGIELKVVIGVNLMNSHNNPVHKVLLPSLLYKNWDIQKLNSLDKATELVSRLMTI